MEFKKKNSLTKVTNLEDYNKLEKLKDQLTPVKHTDWSITSPRHQEN